MNPVLARPAQRGAEAVAALAAARASLEGARLRAAHSSAGERGRRATSQGGRTFFCCGVPANHVGSKGFQKRGVTKMKTWQVQHNESQRARFACARMRGERARTTFAQVALGTPGGAFLVEENCAAAGRGCGGFRSCLKRCGPQSWCVSPKFVVSQGGWQGFPFFLCLSDVSVWQLKHDCPHVFSRGGESEWHGLPGVQSLCKYHGFAGRSQAPRAHGMISAWQANGRVSHPLL